MGIISKLVLIPCPLHHMLYLDILGFLFYILLNTHDVAITFFAFSKLNLI